ncbi:hypothetical protein [Roseimarinus sediminis]|jgi:tetratricopeptide (TPR) repeat protein|uniref:hypothetical protein n=1 Tax=Roseimarinus sediminis TaxID=1610899 RepID=UPI003D207F62
MKAMIKTLTVVLLLFMSVSTFAQRKITGVVYNNGEPAAGILVEAHKSNDSYYTSFDGKYEIEVSPKSKYIRFTFLDESKKLDIEENSSDVINFSLDGGEIPEAGDDAGAILKTLEQLQKDRDMDFLNNYSLYREFFKQDDYRSALPHWRLVYRTYPKSTEQIYIDGLKMMESAMDHAMSTSNKQAYLDTMMMIYDKRMKHMNNVGELMGRKAAKYLETVLKLDISEDEFIKDIKTGFGFAEKSIKESGLKTEPAVLVLYMQSSRRLYSFNEFDQAAVLGHYQEVMQILEEQLKNEDQKAKAEQAIPLIESIIESSGALNCDAMVDLYEPKFKENPNDVEQIKKMLRMFTKNDCDNQLMVKMSEKLYQLEPSAEAAFNMARQFLKKEDYTKAFEYYEEAYNSATDNNAKATYYYEAAGLALQQGMLTKARDLAKQAVAVKSDYCEVYMLLGEIYAQASKTYSEEDFEKSTVFWLAVDYFNKAARYDNCKSDATSKANFYTNYFPTKEDIFYYGLTEGNNHRISGWINETTTVRAK